MPAKPSHQQEPTIEQALVRVAARVSDRVPPKAGSIIIRCTDTDEEYRVEGLGHAPLVRPVVAGDEPPPLVEVAAPSAVLGAVLDGRLEAGRAFAGGGVRVRGDLFYLEAVLTDLGLLHCG